MDLLERLLRHDTWTTGAILKVCTSLTDDQLDREFDIGHRTLRRTLDHIISNMEIWSALMVGDPIPSSTDHLTVPELAERLGAASERLRSVAREVANQDGWENQWQDHLDDPPKMKSFGNAIAHVITHSMHHRAQTLTMLRRCGVSEVPEGDVFHWADATGAH